MSPHPHFRRRGFTFALLLATSPLAIATAHGQASTTLDEISVIGDGGDRGGAPARRGPVPSAPPPLTAPPIVAPPILAPPPVSAASPLDRPVGQVVTSVGREGVIDNRAATNVADLLRNSPGVTVRQGNGPRDFVVSIRGNNARSTGVSRNMAVLEDGFSVTQADGSSRFDLTDPRAYSRIDVFRGPQSAYFGNFASGGALNFVTRRGAEINGVEYGSNAGSFGYLNNYATFGGVKGPFEYSLFLSDARGNGFIEHNSYNTQTINFLGTYAPTPDDRFTLKIINNELLTLLPARSSLNQYRTNPFQRDCEMAATAAPGCTLVTLNGVPVTATEGAFQRNDRRTIVGARWEHDFDAFTTWRTQLVFDDRNIFQPIGTTAGKGDFPGFNVLTDVTRRGDLFGLPATGYVALAYSTLDSYSKTYNRLPYFGPRLGTLSADQDATQDNLGGRARIELQLSDQVTAVAGISAENTSIKGRNISYGYANGGATARIANVDRSFLNVAPELALQYRPSEAWQLRGRVATGYSTPSASNLFVTSAGVPGNNADLKTQENLGFDLGVDWTPSSDLRLSVTGFYEFFRNELVTQTPGGGLLAYTFNAPASEHRGVEVGADWAFSPGWRAFAAYTFDDQIYTKYVEQLGPNTQLDRAGNAIPNVPRHQLLARIGYDQLTGPLAGLGGFVETVFQDDFFVDNSNLLKIPGYTIVNLNLHYATVLTGGYAKRLNLFFEVRNLLDESYIASAQTLANTIGNTSASLADRTGSIYAGAPRTFVGGMKIAF